MDIFVYNSKIILTPYELGELPKIEKKWSVYIPNEFRYDNIACYYEEGVLYIPRGSNILGLSKETGSSPIFKLPIQPKFMEHKRKMRVLPKNNRQIQAINFILGENQFSKNKSVGQMTLVVETGFGKTYCGIAVMVEMGVKTVIVVHSSDVRKQWVDSILKYTNIKESDIGILDEFDDLINPSDKDVVIITHSLISLFANKYGWNDVAKFFDNSHFGLKIVDEVHLCFHSTMMIDFFSNIEKNLYLTATMGRSDDREKKVFNNAFSNAIQYYDKPKDLRKHTKYNLIQYNSFPSQYDRFSIMSSRGFQAHYFADYAFNRDNYKTIIVVMNKILDKALLMDGRLLLVVPKISVIDELQLSLQNRYPNISVGRYHSKLKEDERNDTKENKRIIISTISGLGTGSDIKQLRHIIIAEPFKSSLRCEQLIGRLREYAEDKYTYIWELMDIGFPYLMTMFNKRLPVIEEKCVTLNKYKI